MKTVIEFLKEKGILHQNSNYTAELRIELSNEKTFDVIEIMKQYAKLKCKEQQKLSKEHLYNVGQTVFLTEEKEMPYPNF